jgi:hypothetical protein
MARYRRGKMSPRGRAWIVAACLSLLVGCGGNRNGRPELNASRASDRVALMFTQRLLSGDLSGAKRLVASDSPMLWKNNSFLSDTARHAIAYGEQSHGGISHRGSRHFVSFTGYRSGVRSDGWYWCKSETGRFELTLVAESGSPRVELFSPDLSRFNAHSSIAVSESKLACDRNS